MYSLACFHMYSLTHALHVMRLAQVTRQGCLWSVAHAKQTDRVHLVNSLFPMNASVITLRYELNGTPILTERVALREVYRLSSA